MNSNDYDPHHVESRLDDWINLLITAGAIGLGMGLVNVVLGNFFKNANYTTNFILLIFGVIIVAISLYLLFVSFIRPVHVRSNAYCRVIYNINTAEFLSPFVHSHYYFAQEAAEQIILKSSRADPQVTESLRDKLRDFEIDSDDLYQLIECIVVYWLGRSMVSLFHFRPHLHTLDFNNLPNWLKQNHYLPKP